MCTTSDDVTVDATASAPTTTKTRYTISDCPPTDPTKLQQMVHKHIDTLDLYLQSKPLAHHTVVAFTELLSQLEQQQQQQQVDSSLSSTTTTTSTPPRLVILDSGCGTGRSTLRLGQLFPQHIVIGVDRSMVRLSKQRQLRQQQRRQPSKRSGGTTNQTTTTTATMNDVHEKFPLSNTTTSVVPTLSTMSNDDISDIVDGAATTVAADTNIQTATMEENDDDEEEDESNVGDRSFNNDDDAPTPSLVQQVASNVWLVRAELTDFWRLWILQQQQQWKIDRHYILYPNPYPKLLRIKQRWYAHPSFPLLFQLSTTTILRSNWEQYLMEFAMATRHYYDSYKSTTATTTKTTTTTADNHDFVVELIVPQDDTSKALTNFEEKYWKVGESTYELVIHHRHRHQQQQQKQHDHT